MQYTLNNLYTNDTLDILNGSLEIWFTNNTRNQLNLHVFDRSWDHLCPPLNNWPRWLGGLQVRLWQYDKEEIGTNDFCAQQIKIQLTYCGLRDVVAIRRLNDSHHKRGKKTDCSQHCAGTPRRQITEHFQLPSNRIALKGDAALHTF